MDDDKALRISNREQAVELFATNPDIEAKRVAELLDITPQIVYDFRRDPNFHMQVQDRFMAELENDIPSMVSALKREVLAGNVQATRLMFEYMNKLQKNINITISSPFERWMEKKEGGIEIKDAEIIEDLKAIGDDFSDLPPRSEEKGTWKARNDHISVRNALSLIHI